MRNRSIRVKRRHLATLRNAELPQGCGSHSAKDFAKFLDTSIKSSSELEYQLFLARDYGVLAHADWKSLTAETIDTRRMLCGLRTKVLESDRSKSEKPRKTDER